MIKKLEETLQIFFQPLNKIKTRVCKPSKMTAWPWKCPHSTQKRGKNLTKILTTTGIKAIQKYVCQPGRVNRHLNSDIQSNVLWQLAKQATRSVTIYRQNYSSLLLTVMLEIHPQIIKNKS